MTLSKKQNTKRAPQPRPTLDSAQLWVARRSGRPLLYQGIRGAGTALCNSEHKCVHKQIATSPDAAEGVRLQ
jgi:hypothetical protein